MDEHLSRCIDFLKGVHANRMDHSGGTLLAHLLGTRAILVRWGVSPPLADAGLFHSVYSTESYASAVVPLLRRDQVRELIGPDAERLAWLFCVMQRESFDANLARVDKRVDDRVTGERVPIDDQEFADLVNLSCANTLEAMPRLWWWRRRVCRSYLTRYDKVAMPAAQVSMETDRGLWWQVWR